MQSFNLLKSIYEVIRAFRLRNGLICLIIAGIMIILEGPVLVKYERDAFNKQYSQKIWKVNNIDIKTNFTCELIDNSECLPTNGFLELCGQSNSSEFYCRQPCLPNFRTTKSYSMILHYICDNWSTYTWNLVSIPAGLNLKQKKVCIAGEKCDQLIHNLTHKLNYTKFWTSKSNDQNPNKKFDDYRMLDSVNGFYVDYYNQRPILWGHLIIHIIYISGIFSLIFASSWNFIEFALHLKSFIINKYFNKINHIV